MDILKRLYIFTGKGGVGKSALSLAFTLHLNKNGKNAKFVYFNTNKLDEESLSFNETETISKELSIPTIGLELIDAAKDYMGSKLKSQTIANWIVKTPFFKSALNMVPGFNYLIYLGQIIQRLEDDPSLIIVLDSPSSGHAQTMLEATRNFSDVFQSGAIYQDTLKIIEKINSPEFTQVNIITLPTALAVNESTELKTALSKTGTFEQKIFCNYCLSDYNNEDLPQSIAEKINNEETVLKEIKDAISHTIPYTTAENTIKGLVPFMQNLV